MDERAGWPRAVAFNLLLVEVASYLSTSDSAVELLVLTSVTPPRLSEPPGGDSLDVVPPMDLNELFYLRDGGPMSPHDERPYPDTLRTHRGRGTRPRPRGLPHGSRPGPFRKG